MPAVLCPSREELLEYAVGKLPDDASDTLADHLDGCPACQAQLAALPEADDTLVARLRGPVEADPFAEESGYGEAMARAKAVVDGTGAGEADDSGSRLPRQLGEYRLIQRLGSGGMGTVYKAQQGKLDRVVALKFLSRAHTDDPRAVARFEREMKAIGRLDHPQIVRAYDAREIDGQLVLAMEFVEGLDLGRIVRRLGRLDPADACELARQAALGLQAAHEHGLVHRDVKPSNLMLTPQGRVKLLDLGLARLHTEPADDETTGTGHVLGTADYMAPEQAAESRTVDIRADIYSLGCTLYKLLTGRVPFSGPQYPTVLDKMMAHRREPLPPVRESCPEIPEGPAAVLDRMLAKAPDARYATPAEVAEALSPWCAGAALPALLQRAVEADEQPAEHTRDGSPQATQPAPASRPQPTPGRRKSMAAMLGMMLLAGGIGLACGIVLRIERNGQETQIEVPDGSKVQVAENGKVQVTLPGQSGPAPAAGGADSNVKLELMGRVEDFFLHNFRDVTARKSLEWSDVKLGQDGSRSIRYQYQAVIWGKETKIMNQDFTFDAQGTFVSVNEVKDDEPQPQGPVLVYEVDPTASPRGVSAEDMEKLLKVIERRLNSTKKVAKISESSGRRIEVALLRRGDADQQRVERLLARPGTLEFRVLAHRVEHAAIIRQAESEPQRNEVLGPEGKKLAWWVTAGDPTIGPDSKDVVTRRRTVGDAQTLEALVVNDACDVTGANVIRAAVERDPSGYAKIDITLDEAGGRRLERLTAEHLPDPATANTFRLGIILDGMLRSAPTLRAKMAEQAAITGRFSDQEAAGLADVLNSGSLPVPIRPVPPERVGSANAPVEPAADELAIRGTWQVVGSTFSLLRRLPREPAVAPEQVCKSTRVIITADALKIVGPEVVDFAFQYQLNPASKPTMIDLQTPGKYFGLVAYGIYQFEGNTLKICTSGLRSLCVDDKDLPNALALRPREFWAELGSNKEMLVLRRAGDAAVSSDETLIQGTWRVEQLVGGSSPFGDHDGQEITFLRHELVVKPDASPQSAAMHLGYALDPTASPKRFDIANTVAPDPAPAPGAYELTGDRLTIAWDTSAALTVEDIQPFKLPPAKLSLEPGMVQVVLKRVSGVAGGPAAAPAAESKAQESKAGPER
jgi:uncharacterized protein (TIGR03067 family)